MYSVYKQKNCEWKGLRNCSLIKNLIPANIQCDDCLVSFYWQTTLKADFTQKHPNT